MMRQRVKNRADSLMVLNRMIKKDKKERALILVYELHGYLKRRNMKFDKNRVQ